MADQVPNPMKAAAGADDASAVAAKMRGESTAPKKPLIGRQIGQQYYFASPDALAQHFDPQIEKATEQRKAILDAPSALLDILDAMAGGLRDGQGRPLRMRTADALRLKREQLDAQIEQLKAAKKAAKVGAIPEPPDVFSEVQNFYGEVPKESPGP